MSSRCDRERTRERSRTRLTRRSLLAAGSALAGGLSGCAAGGDDDGSPTETPPTTGDASPAPTGEPTGTATESATPTDDGPPRFDATTLHHSPSSHVAPADGFADVDWLAAAAFRVTKVTSLESDGEGSLRWAASRLGTNVVVFEVGGVIDLDGEPIELTSPHLFVAGQTAPSPGITLIRGGIDVQADNVLLQHLRVRPGDDLPSNTDCIGNSGGTNVIVDHCSATWGTDEGVSTNGGPGNPNVTFTNNLIAEGLHDSIHSKGTHSYGTLVMDRSERVTIAGNLWANNTGRHPRLKGGSSSVVANNVAYNFERATNLGGGVDDETIASIVGNYYRAGDLTDQNDPALGTIFTDAEGPVRVYLEENATDPTSMPVIGDDHAITLVEDRPLWPERLQALAGRAAYDAVLSTAGARPADRTLHDERIVADVRESTGSRIDSQEEVGGYPELSATTRELDVPQEGFAEWLHRHTRAVERSDASVA